MKKSIWARRRAAYRTNLRVLGLGLLLAWRNVGNAVPPVWRALRDLGRHSALLILVLLAPALSLFSPLLAAYGVWHDERQAARRKSAPSDEPDEHETHCGCSDCF